MKCMNARTTPAATEPERRGHSFGGLLAVILFFFVMCMLAGREAKDRVECQQWKRLCKIPVLIKS